MGGRWQRFFYYFLPLVLMLAAACFQVNIWSMWLGEAIPAPPFWLLIFIFLIFYRDDYFNLFYIYLLGLFILPFSILNLKVLWTSLLLLYFILRFFKRHVFWQGPGYFFWASCGGVFVFHIIYILVSRWLEPQGISYLWTERLTQTLLCLPFSFLIYKPMQRIEGFRFDEPVHP